jgi:hypothetical protein
MNVGCVLCFDNGQFASFVAKLFKMFGDNGRKFFFWDCCSLFAICGGKVLAISKW